jgi:Mg2+/Co2+ transporter CorB
MIKKLISTLMNKKYNNYCIYSHNLSGFDGVFLLKHLISFVNKEKKLL